MKKRSLAALMMFVFLLTALCTPLFAAGTAVEDTLTLATTTSTQDSGLLDVLIPAFEKEFNTKVKVIAVGSGQAMEMGKAGDADVLLVHSRKAEDEFMAAGSGSVRKDVMHNEFLIVGPKKDPAGIKGMTDVQAAFKKIADGKFTFISRADKSGTHSKELAIWAKMNVTPKGEWYVEAGQGMGATLNMALEKDGYTLTDEATYLTWKDAANFAIILRGDKLLLNPYGVIVVNPEKHAGLHVKAATAFAEWITGEKGQKMIMNFGQEKYKKSLFTPDAIPAAKLTAPPAPAKPAVAADLGTFVVLKSVSVKAGAGSGKVVAKLKKGQKITVVKAAGKYYMVKMNGKTGYVLKALLKKAA
ncbi:MAG: substrate-binding domain-containing protein [Solirubrobacterales bacterium]